LTQAFEATCRAGNRQAAPFSKGATTLLAGRAVAPAVSMAAMQQMLAPVVYTSRLRRLDTREVLAR
jgi:hypothetical protein